MTKVNSIDENSSLECQKQLFFHEFFIIACIIIIIYIFKTYKLIIIWFQIIIPIISIIVSIIFIAYHAQYVKPSNMIQTFIFKVFITIFMYGNKVFMIPNIKSIFFKYLSLHFDHDTNIHDIKSTFIMLHFSNNS